MEKNPAYHTWEGEGFTKVDGISKSQQKLTMPIKLRKVCVCNKTQCSLKRNDILKINSCTSECNAMLFLPWCMAILLSWQMEEESISQERNKKPFPLMFQLEHMLLEKNLPIPPKSNINVLLNYVWISALMIVSNQLKIINSYRYLFEISCHL